MQLFGYTKLLTYVNAKVICLFVPIYDDCEELMKMILQNYAVSSNSVGPLVERVLKNEMGVHLVNSFGGYHYFSLLWHK